MTNDEELKFVEKVQKDPSLFGVLYTKYLKRVYAFFWHRVGKSKAIAEELMQETFLKAFRALPKFQRASVSYFSYLMRIARNLLTTYYRKKKTVHLEELSDLPGANAADVEEGIEISRMWEFAGKLPDESRRILAMRYKDGLAIQEISAATGKTENAVKIILARSRKHISKKMNADAKDQTPTPFV
jgi:RNA polymerase sigma-70 factor (ECF subfamily)